MSNKNAVNRHGLHFRTEMFLWTLVLCTAQAAITGLAFFSISTRTLYENEKENITQLVNVVNQDIESRVESFNSISLDAVINNEVKSSLNVSGSLEAGRAKSRIQDFLANKTLSAHGLLDLSIIDISGNTYSTRAVYHLPDNFNLKETDVFKAAAEGNGALVWLNSNSIIDNYGWDSDLVTSRMPGLRAAAVIKDYNRGEYLGLLMLTLREDYFQRINYSNRKLKNIRMYLVSPDRAISLTVAGTHSRLTNDVFRLIEDNNTRKTLITEDSNHNLVSYIYNNAMGWFLVSTTAYSEINNSFRTFIKLFLIILLFSATASVALSWWATNIFTRDLSKLADKMMEVEKGNFDIQVDISRKDEIGWLAEVFNSMVRRTKTLIDTTYKQELLTRDAEFRALQAQINPHFLYNTLDMINWRLIAAEQHDLSSSVVSLGNLLRYSISAGNEVLLEDEIQNMEDYIFLRQSNRDPLFEYIKNLEGNRGLKLPKLTLQPLIENAIIHGFGRRRNGNLLEVTGNRTEAESYKIRIKDNGIGMDTETLKAVADAMLVPGRNETENIRKNRMHIGVTNVDRRLKHMYGEKYGLSIESSFGEGTAVTVTIPYTEE